MWADRIEDIETGGRSLSEALQKEIVDLLGVSLLFPEEIYQGDVKRFVDFCISRGLDFTFRTVQGDERPFTKGARYFAAVYRDAPILGCHSYSNSIGRVLLGALLRFATNQSREDLLR